MRKKITVAVLPLKGNGYFQIINQCIEDYGCELVDYGVFMRSLRYLWRTKIVFLSFFEEFSVESKKDFLSFWIQLMRKLGAVILMKMVRCKIVVIMHNELSHDQDQFRKYKKFIYKFIFIAADRIVIMCNESKNAINRLFKNADPIIRKTFKILHPEYSSIYGQKHIFDFRKANGINEEDIVLMCFGQIRPYKQIECLVDVAKMLPGNVKIVVLGTGPDKQYVEQIEKKGQRISNFIFINKYIEDYDVENYFKMVDAFILPYSEGSLNSGVVMTAFTYGKPVICSKIGTIGEFPSHFTFLYEESSSYEVKKVNLLSAIERYIRFRNDNNTRETERHNIHIVRELCSTEKTKERIYCLMDELMQV